MPKTRRELIDATLDNLNILVPGQSPSDEEVARVDGRLDPGFAMLAAMDVVYVADTGLDNPPTGGEIEDALFLLLADVFAYLCGGAFNQGDSPELKVKYDIAIEQLRIIGRPASTRQTLRTDGQLRGGRAIRTTFGNFTQGT